MNLRADFSDFEAFGDKSNRHFEKDAAEGMYKGVRRSLAGFRKDFFRATQVDFEGKNSGGQGQPRSRFRSIGQSFKWRMNTRKAPKRLKDVGGSIGSTSPAAYAMEKGTTAKNESGGKYLAIPLIKVGKENTTPRGKVKRKWRSAQIAQNDPALARRFDFFTHTDSDGTKTIRAKYKRGRKKGTSFPAFLLKEETKQDKILRFEYTWKKNRNKNMNRIQTELGKSLRRFMRRKKRK